MIRPPRPAGVPDPKIALTLQELTDCQHLAMTHVTFSLTLACPLRCAHCIVDADRDKGQSTMSLGDAERYAREMRALKEYGIKGVCFTGGEPFLARRQLSRLSLAAAEAGMEVSVVTAAPWATTREGAAALVEAFPGIQCWDISSDVHHLPWVGIDQVRWAAAALNAAGRQATIRFTYTDPMTEADQSVLAELAAIDGCRCVAQATRPVGRAKDLCGSVRHGWSPWVKPCLTQGMVVRYDGSVAPCCLNLVESRRHPFDFGDPRELDLVEVHRNFACHPLLQLIRALGFSQIREWIEAADLAHCLPNPPPEEVCELCEHIMHQPSLANLAVRRAGTGDLPLRIAILAEKVLGERQLLERLGVTDLRVLTGESA